MSGVAAKLELAPLNVLIVEDSEEDADLIVLYRHTRGGLSRKLLGSVGDEVIRGAEVPVLLVGETTQTGLDAVG